MRKSLTCIFAAFAFAAFDHPSLHAQAPTGTIRGRVTFASDQSPIHAAAIIVSNVIGGMSAWKSAKLPTV